MTRRIGVGQFFAWEGGCLFIGHHDRQLPLHAHQAMQLVVASEGDHRVRGSESEPWSTYSIAAIAVANARRLVTTLGAGVDRTEVNDPRIMSVIVYINQHLDRAITLNEAASYACLSPSRLRHVFTEQIGMGLRPYIL